MQPPIPTSTILQSRYRILSILGQGGFGRTYLAEDQGRFNELCAIKELTPPQDNPYALEKSKELFQREAQTLYSIQHPQIPQFRATFEQDQRFFIVQDYVEGSTYRALLDERKSRGYVFSESEVTQLVKQVLPVLAYIHGKGIIHRDIAPDNIILRDRDKLPVLIDFGVVKDLATRIQAQETVKQHTTVGKLGYAPTEQMQTGRAYPNSDLYALAVTAVVLLTGREPQDLFDENTMTWRWQRYVNLEPTFAQVLNRMLSYRVGDRFQSASEVMHVLQAPATIAPLPATPPPTNVQPTNVQPTNVSKAETVAIGHRNNSTVAPTNLQTRNDPSIPSRSSLWDDPWAVFAIGTGLVLLTGLGAWTITRALMNAGQPVASPTPTPTVSVSPSPTTTPTTRPSPSPSPSPSPVTYSQQLDLSTGAAARSGTLRSNETLNFIIPANQGQRLSASSGSEGILLSVLAPNGEPVDSSASRVSNWSGELPFTGNYTVQLRTVRGIPKSDFKLNVNLQTPTPSPTPSPSPSPSPTITVSVVSFPAGQTSTQVSNTVNPSTIHRYLINLRANQTLSLDLSQGARFTVRYPDGRPVEDATNLQSWQGIVPTSGDYQVDVTSDRETSFTLSVGAK